MKKAKVSNNRTMIRYLLPAVLASSIHSVTVAEGAGTEGLFLEEVTVTAQKRAQSSQDIGIAVAAVTGDSLREKGIDGAGGLASIIPNVSFLNVSGGGVPILIVRGVGLQNFRINDSPTTATYIDEVYQTSIVSTDFTMFDLERVELLKGPQGGLYGRNAVSGALQVISEQPEIGGDADGYAKLGYGKFAKKEVEAGVNIPISDTAAARISGRWVNSDDTEYESVTAGFDHGKEDRWAARALLNIEPNDTTQLRFKIHGGKDQSDIPLVRAVGIYEDLGTLAENGGTGTNAANIGQGARTSTLCPSILSGNGVNGNCATVTGATLAELGLGNSDSDRYDVASGFASFVDISWVGASLIADFELDDYTLTSISAYDTVDYQRFVDTDAILLQFAHIDYQSELEAWSQEFRLAYNGSDNYNWVAGINYAEDTLDENSLFLGRDGLLPVFFGGAVALPQDYDQSTEALAVYAHGEWAFTENWNLVGELRYTDVEKTFKGEELLTASDGTNSPFLSFDDSTSFDAVSGKLALEWRPLDDVLTYASVSRGFKSGGFFGGFITNAAQFEAYDEETIWAYEIGIKSELFENRLRANASAFYYDREGVQQSARATSGGEVQVNRLTNIGDVVAKGVELDLTWLAAEGLMLQLALGYTESEIADSDLVSASVQGVANSSIEGLNSPNYSPFTANFNLQYERPIADGLLGRAQLEYNYNSERDLNLITDKQLEEDLLTQPGYSITNLRLSIEPEDAQWTAQVFVNNAADTAYRTQVRGDGLRGVYEGYGAPRTWGVAFTYNWD